MPRVTTPDRFWSQVDSSRGENACWPWNGRLSDKGYGVVGFERRMQKTHRVAWQLQRGTIPTGVRVLHKCDNPPCCNPKHLFLGTQLDNIADREAKGRGSAPPSRRILTNEQVHRLRAEYDSGLATQAALAERYGVSRGNLSKILNRRSYVDA